jgi:hypothetical protein
MEDAETLSARDAAAWTITLRDEPLSAFAKRLALTFALSATVMAGGCASTTWQRPGAEPLVVQNDLEQCWSEADAAVPADPAPFQPEPSFGLVPGQSGGRATSALVVPNPVPADATTSVQQRRLQLVGRCMRARGYTSRQ